jgi:ELWxxDGT repeat protein
MLSVMEKAKGMVTMVRNDAIALLLLCALSSFPPAQASASDVPCWEPEPTGAAHGFPVTASPTPEPVPTATPTPTSTTTPTIGGCGDVCGNQPCMGVCGNVSCSGPMIGTCQGSEGNCYCVTECTPCPSHTPLPTLTPTPGTTPAARVHLVKDIFPGADPNGFSNPDKFVVVDGKVLFTADDGMHGRELWRTDGTEAGTVLVKDINAGPRGSFSEPTLTAVVNGVMLFSADDGVHGSELWRSDGTAKGTVLVKDIGPGSAPAFLGDSLVVGNTLFFSATDLSGAELWKSDGTEFGTVQVADINPGPAGSAPVRFTESSGIIFFVANDGTYGCELWRTDGTAAGTVLVKDVDPGQECIRAVGPYGIFVYTGPWSLTDVSGTLFFVQGDALWKTDGTATGTAPVRWFGGFCVQFEAFSCPPTYLMNANGTLYFQAEEYPFGRELWKSDGTDAGTVMVKDINTKPCVYQSYPDTCSSFPSGFTAAADGEVFFTATDSSGNVGRWVTDGTAEGTEPAPEPTSTPGPAPDVHQWPGASAILNGVLIFGDRELYKTDGTQAGTVLLKDINTRPASSFPNQLTDMGGTLYFFANDGNGPSELWRSDGTGAGTTLVKNINSGASGVRALTAASGQLFFIADDGVHGFELWHSDGTAAGTALVKDIAPGPTGGLWFYYPPPSPELVTLNDVVFFAANDQVDGAELWRSDGTDAGTYLIRDINPGPGWSTPQQFTVLNHILLFSAFDGTASTLWKTDGTRDGTVQVAGKTCGSYPYGLTVTENAVFFFASDPSNGGWLLCKTDGSAGGTLLIKSGFPGTPAPSNPVAAGGRLFFLSGEPATGDRQQLWTSDGTETGTVMLKRIDTAESAFIPFVSPLGNAVLFGIASGNGQALWTSDGTEQGTVLIKNITSQYPGTRVQPLVSIDGILLFSVADQTGEAVLWRSDGTETGTVPLPVAPPSLVINTYPAPITAGANLYFAADDGATGIELWAWPLGTLLSTCVGDCNSNWAVTVDELIMGVNIALGNLTLAQCANLDVNADGTVTIDEIMEAVGHALNGC